MLSSKQIAALLELLGLTQAIFKPIPDLVGGLAAPLSGPLSGVVGAVDGITHGLGLPGLSDLPLIGGILKETDAMGTQNVFKSLTVSHQVMSTDGSCNVQPYNPPPVLSQTFPPFDQAKANVFRYRQQQAVNLGSWFVHEQWMTPSLFTCASGPKGAEIDIASGWGNTTGARAVLENHWDTFIKQSDFEYLSSIGINTVRLPIGYWSLGPLYCQGTPFEPVADVYANSWSRIVRAINWAGEAGIGVLIDLHGAVGSQNGQGHSGISDGQANFFNDPKNMDLTTKVLVYLAQQLASVTNVIGIELLNEPNDEPSLKDFYTTTITSMRQTSPEAATLPIYIHDAFNVEQFSEFVSSRKDFVVEDHHSYFVFGPNDANTDSTTETQIVEGPVSNQLTDASQKEHHNIIVGEWSCALLAGSLANQKDPMSARQQFCQGQEQAYANITAGWHFWSYMKEDCDTDLDWCFKNAVGSTLPATFFSYNSTPSSSQDKSLLLTQAVAKMALPSMTEVLDKAGTWPSSDNAEASGTVPSSADSGMPLPSGSPSRRNLAPAPPSRQRFFSIHSRRAFLSDIARHKKDGIPSPLAGLTAAERSITKGYSDGYLTGKIFAQYGMSRLGFVAQYITDSIAALGPKVVAPGTEDNYRDWFLRGLQEAEDVIRTAVNH